MAGCWGCRVSCEEVNGKDAFGGCLDERVCGGCDIILFLLRVVKHIYYLNVAWQLVQQAAPVSTDIHWELVWEETVPPPGWNSDSAGPA